LQGHIVTNYHVIQNARAAQVTLANNRKFEATLRGYEGDKDLAVLKIEAPPEELVPIEVGVSSRLVVGQRVFAIGAAEKESWVCVRFGTELVLACCFSGLGRLHQD
jgi:S1-C subfamily serine protease